MKSAQKIIFSNIFESVNGFKANSKEAVLI